MSGRAEPVSRAAPPRRWRPQIGRTWIARIALAVIVVAALALVGRVSMMAFSGGSKRAERFEQSGGARTAMPHRAR
jgi:DNA-binding transcriptional regulator of glucitol operon